MNLSTPGLPVHHQLPEFTQTQVHQVSDGEEKKKTPQIMHLTATPSGVGSLPAEGGS